jgi:amino acid transporter
MAPHLTLRRVVGTPLLALYGIGNIVGVGIYVLIGQIAATAGYLTVISFIIAALVAFCAALSYAELATRFPVSAGISVYLQEAFRAKHVSTIVGLLLVAIGAASTATLLKGFSGYFYMLLPISPIIVSGGLVMLLTLLAACGIKESVTAAAILTVLEIGGLLFLVGSIIWSQPDAVASFGNHFTHSLGNFNSASLGGIVSASFIAFYAFVGFEDTVNIAEEVKSPRTAYPRALFVAMGLVTVLYILVAIVVLGVLTPTVLSQTDAPLARAYEVATGNTANVIIFVSLVGSINGIIVTMTMGSRFLYGLSKREWITPWFAKLTSRRVPLRGLLVMSIAALAGALWLPIERSAQITSLLLLVVFLGANASLILIRRRDIAGTDSRLTPHFVPWFGAIASGVLLVGQLVAMACGMD